MNFKELNKEYDKLQLEYGSKELHPIYSGGCRKKPLVLFVFMNPTAKNIASFNEWKGRRLPWIGSKNIWKLFYELDLLDKDIYDEIMIRKGKDWDEKFADLVYENVEKHKYFITNLGKCTQIDARPLPDLVFKKYLDLLYKEIDLVRPKIIVTFGNQVSSIVLDENIQVSKCRQVTFKRVINNIEYNIYPTYYPVGNGMRNIDKTIEDLSKILKKIN
ncbi:MAG: uracil-DNA glycosylase family protein [Bacilli bacterium]|nr:uracil-DNA glycosylase family protein [Bacilli bacterium]